MEKLKEILQRIAEEISWDNWENEDGTLWKTSQVIFCKLEWILDGDEEISEESRQTIKDARDIIESLENICID